MCMLQNGSCNADEETAVALTIKWGFHLRQR